MEPNHGLSEATDDPTSVGERRRVPATIVVWVIMAINVGVWIAMELAGGSTTTRTLIAFGAKVNPLIAQGEYWRLVTPVFIHIGLMHLMFNSFALLSFGRVAEMIFGHSRFLAIYLVSGITGVALSYFFSRSLSAGASGAIFGVSGALVVFYAYHRGVPRVSGQGELKSMLLVLSLNAVFGVLQPGIDNWGHAGGLLGGLALAMWLKPMIRPITGDEGIIVGMKRDESSLATWLSVPVVVVILAMAVLVLPPR